MWRVVPVSAVCVHDEGTLAPFDAYQLDCTLAIVLVLAGTTQKRLLGFSLVISERSFKKAIENEENGKGGISRD